jgi:hypothetical protein
VSETKAALDAQTDQVLAHLAAMRRRGGAIAIGTLPAAWHMAAQLRVQFPGRDKDTARVLAAAAAVLFAIEGWLSENKARPELIGPVLLDVLGYAADDLNQDGSDAG